MTEEIIHVPLGFDCTLAYQLQQHHLRYQSLPFDWMKINSIDSIIEILNNQFLKFFDESEWIISSQSDNFDFIFDEHMDTKTPLKFESKLSNSNSNSNSYSESKLYDPKSKSNSNSNSKSKLKLNHKTYKIIFTT